MTITLITFDGFVKQLEHPGSDGRVIRIPTERRKGRVGHEFSIYDPVALATFDVRTFLQEGNTTVYKEASFGY